ncbi:MAG: hypothetical protein GXO63_00085, partial [Candidatus Micrarchaeota archaeon]|nr:hypothetical protein [Candidatus Micrarchaeota archaeon]
MKGTITLVGLIMITVIAVFSVFFYFLWASQTQSTVMQGVEEQSEGVLMKEKACLKIIKANSTSVTVWNCGRIELKNFMVYANESIIGNFTGIVEPGDSVIIEFIREAPFGFSDIKVTSDKAWGLTRIYREPP